MLVCMSIPFFFSSSSGRDLEGGRNRRAGGREGGREGGTGERDRREGGTGGREGREGGREGGTGGREGREGGKCKAEGGRVRFATSSLTCDLIYV